MNNYLSKIYHKKLHIPNMLIFLLSKLCRIYYAQKGITFYPKKKGKKYSLEKYISFILIFNVSIISIKIHN